MKKEEAEIGTGEDLGGVGEAESGAGDEISSVIVIRKGPKRGAGLVGVGGSGEDVIQGPGGVEIEIQVHEEVRGATGGVGGHLEGGRDEWRREKEGGDGEMVISSSILQELVESNSSSKYSLSTW